ncbi:hypothetical protein EN817_20795 [Mesorhizobium sp. M3A.F.Ca.ET.174.01.1.1]|uniref:hypothetical protein n=1 Tax=unclassified Mesorhizobium TaxID=325217 RepID=UPI001093F6A3|nr:MULTISPECIES: hypothetical protein [unclassified Mesorhizobium]TGS85775.1 hypothetical protein EN818_17545 [Mesorhizobium sp. M3A.F.Ca.ET.175.01.1.1]TGT23915.1 hypothetical protein EN817_20795 [Mesorhizobium sp. M3A.F.Ca.ET.174.01.1.1]
MSMLFYRALFVMAIFNQCIGASCLIDQHVSLAVSAPKVQVAGLEQESKKQLDKNKDLLT